VEVADRAGFAHDTGPESCARLGNGVRDAWTGERAGRVGSPALGLCLGADALRTRGRPPRARRSGQADTPLAGSKTPGLHGNIGRGTREARRRAWAIAARPAW
jgi:hypothetical protein